MKATAIIFILLFSGSMLWSQNDTLRLSADIHIGRPGFNNYPSIISFKHRSANSPWKKTEQDLSGIPKSWTDYYRNDIWFQSPQFAYQNFKAGKLDPTTFSDLMTSWQFDTAHDISSEWVACYTNMIFRKTDSGAVEYIIDSDVDHDLSDEQTNLAVKQGIGTHLDSLLPHAVWVNYQIFNNGRLIQDSVPLLVRQNESKTIGTFLTYYTPVYAQAVLGVDTFIVTPRRPDFEDFSLRKLEGDSSESRSLFPVEKLRKGQRIKLQSKWYKIESFERGPDELLLTEINLNRDTIYPQRDFHAPDFSVSTLYTNEQLSLSDFKGKYLLLDFWGTWCKPCIYGIPELVEMYEQLKQHDFEILSIAYRSDREKLESLKNEKSMDWLHVMRNSQEGIISDYLVKGYPTFVLIDPEGKVAGRNLSLKEIIRLVSSP